MKTKEVNPCFVVVRERKTTDNFHFVFEREEILEKLVFEENCNKNPKTTIDQRRI